MQVFSAYLSKWIGTDCVWVEDDDGNRYSITQANGELGGLKITKVDESDTIPQKVVYVKNVREARI